MDKASLSRLSRGRRVAAFIIAQAVALVLGSLSWGSTFYVAPNGNDANAGTAAKPFRTVQKAIAQAAAGGAVHIKPGQYDLAGFSATVDKPLSLIGEDSKTTVLAKGGGLTVTAAITVKNLTFAEYRRPVLQLAPDKDQKIGGVVVESCTFRDLATGIYTKKRIEGTITNVSITKCEFTDLKGGGVKAVCLAFGRLSNVTITHNTFRRLVSSRKGCAAIIVGSNATRGTTRDALIADNRFETVHGPTTVRKGAGAEVHAVLAYGVDVRILRNTVKDLNAGRDHEALYMKASDSTIADNVVENCGSGGGGGDICSKGGRDVHGNVISGNQVTGDRPGRGIFAVGGTVIKDNYIRKPQGFNGIDIYAFGKPVVVTDNYVETKRGSAIRLDSGDKAVISDNVLVSYEGKTLGIHASKGTVLKNNREHKGKPAKPLVLLPADREP